ncbi:MAG: hypothetical protein EOO12_03920 [Chitinophagaceae bacterium]|nr:MAG: hypothetical protein EOO12_03920 [Chitinophagaceae bacterium]
MAKTNSESGFAVILGNFDTAITRVSGIGARFSPNRADLKVDALKEYYTRCSEAHGAVKDATEAYQNATAARTAAFDGLPKLATRVVSAFFDSDASEADRQQVQAIKRRIDGKPAAAPAAPAATGEEAEAQHSTSQRSFIRLADHLDGIIRACKAARSYNPADADLAIPALEAFHTQLLATNTAVDTSFAARREARKQRSRLFYDEATGIPALAKRLRGHLKSRGDEQKDLLKGLRFPSRG